MVPEVLLPLELPPPPLQPERAPNAATANRTTSSDDHLRRRAGVIMKRRQASTAPLLEASQPRLDCFMPAGSDSNAVVAAVVLTVTVPVVVEVLLVRFTAGAVVQVGRVVAPVGEEVRLQARLTDPT